MGREVKRVASDFNWPLHKIWRGYINPYWQYQQKCCECNGSGYSDAAQLMHDEWYGCVNFDPVAYGSQLLTPDTPFVKAFVECHVDRSINAAKTGTAMQYDKENGFSYDGTNCHYTDNGRLTREEAIAKESARLLEIWNHSWNHHIIQADVDALIEADNDGHSALWDFTHRPLKNTPMEEYIRTHAYFLWIEAGKPDRDSSEFWLASEKAHRYWLPYSNGYIPTIEEINFNEVFSLGHNLHFTLIKARCKREGHPYLCDLCNGDGNFWTWPDAEKLAKEWEPEEPPVGEAYQIWETVSEGSPISPPCRNPQILAEWMSNDGPKNQRLPAEDWLKFILGPGWAPSMVIGENGIQSGVEAVVEFYENQRTF